MKNKLKPNKLQKHRARLRMLYAFAFLSFSLFIAGSILVVLNFNNLEKIRASSTGEQGGGGNEQNSGEIIYEFNWENDSPVSAASGPKAISISKTAHIMPGGQAASMGLSPGAAGENIDMVIQSENLFKLDGIDISIDYRRDELSGDFFTHDKNFNFGMKDGFVYINYSTQNNAGKQEVVRVKTGYEIPMDPLFRNYRFIYTPTIGKGELYVNNIIIWQHEGEKNSPLMWNNSDNLIIGKNMNGGGFDRAIFDNLVIKSTVSVTPLAESLINFMLESRNEGGVNIHWSSTAKEKVAYFSIERSFNGINFTSIGKVNANIETSEDAEYTFTDPGPITSQVAYYRLRQSLKNGKFIIHAMSAIRFKSKDELSIEKINPQPFDKSCDISYFLPKAGHVSIQISDNHGTIVSTTAFDAPKGKNVHVFRDKNNLNKGTYTFSLVFENKKVCAKAVKI